MSIFRYPVLYGQPPSQPVEGSPAPVPEDVAESSMKRAEEKFKLWTIALAKRTHKILALVVVLSITYYCLQKFHDYAVYTHAETRKIAYKEYLNVANLIPGQTVDPAEANHFIEVHYGAVFKSETASYPGVYIIVLIDSVLAFFRAICEVVVSCAQWLFNLCGIAYSTLKLCIALGGISVPSLLIGIRNYFPVGMFADCCRICCSGVTRRRRRRRHNGTPVDYEDSDDDSSSQPVSSVQSGSVAGVTATILSGSAPPPPPQTSNPALPTPSAPTMWAAMQTAAHAAGTVAQAASASLGHLAKSMQSAVGPSTQPVTAAPSQADQLKASAMLEQEREIVRRWPS